MRRPSRTITTIAVAGALLALCATSAMAKGHAHAIALPLHHQRVRLAPKLPTLRQIKTVVAKEIRLGTHQLHRSVYTLKGALQQLLSPLLWMKDDPNKENHAHRHRKKKSGKQKAAEIKKKREDKKKDKKKQ